MPSFTCWTRLESSAREKDIATGLQARLYDPLWLLARQWQMGEFAGEDAGTPVSVRLRAERLPLTRYHPGPLPADGRANGRPYDPARLPLETLVEREPALRPQDQRPDRRFAAEAGLHFLQLLTELGVGHLRPLYLQAYPPPPLSATEQAELDPESARFLAVVGRRAPDGIQLYDDLRPILRPAAGGVPSLPTRPAVPAGDRSEVIVAGLTYLTWFESLFSVPDGAAEAWTAERMEYAFALAAPTSGGELVLAAPEYQGGHLDWYAFDVAPGAALGTPAAPAPEVSTLTVIPGPARYPGMPAARWWEFEDVRINFGAVSAAPDELLRLLLVEFALTYGNDWFIAPFEADLGAVYRLRSVVVTDAFGERTRIPHYDEVDAAGAGWQLFNPSLLGRGQDEPAAGLLVLPPALAASLQGPTLEEVLFLRDEMANMAWAVERVVPNALGQPLDRYEAYRRRLSGAAGEARPPNGDGTSLRYRLATTVPDYWLPLVPVRPDPTRPDIRLRRGRVLLDDGGEPAIPQSRGRILEPGRPLELFEEEVPRAGVRVTRAFQIARWTDGSTHLWLSRRKAPGRGEGFSGLRYDFIELEGREP